MAGGVEFYLTMIIVIMMVQGKEVSKPPKEVATKKEEQVRRKEEQKQEPCKERRGKVGFEYSATGRFYIQNIARAAEPM